MGSGEDITVAALCRIPRLRPRAIINVLPSVIKQIEHEELFRVYVCECLQLAPQNKYVTARYADLIKPQKVDKRSAEEIAADIITKAGLTLE